MALVRGSLQSEVNPSLHRWVLTLEQIDVAVQLPDPERHKHRGVAPALDPAEVGPVGRVARLELRRVGPEAHDLVGLARREWLPGREVDPGDVPEVDITVGTEELAVPQVYFVSGGAEDAPLEPDP